MLILAALVGAGTIGTTLIEIPSWGSVSMIEALWTLSGLLMIAVSAWALPRVASEWAVARRVPGRYFLARSLLARGHVRREVIRLVQGLIVVSVGIFAVLSDPSRPGPVVVTPLGLVLTAGLFLLALLSSVQSILDRRQAGKAERLIVNADMSLLNEPPEPPR